MRFTSGPHPRCAGRKIRAVDRLPRRTEASARNNTQRGSVSVVPYLIGGCRTTAAITRAWADALRKYSYGISGCDESSRKHKISISRDFVQFNRTSSMDQHTQYAQGQSKVNHWEDKDLSVILAWNFRLVIMIKTLSADRCGD